MDYSPWVERDIWAVFESSGISETGEVTPTKIGVHALDINPYLDEFFEADSDRLNFLMTMDYSLWVEREIWLFLRVAVSPKMERSRPPKLVYMHCYINPYLHKFLRANSDRLNFLMTMDYSPWVEREIWPFLRVAVSPKMERSCTHQNWCTCMLTSIPTCINFLG